jgi:hypothetical protein
MAYVGVALRENFSVREGLEDKKTVILSTPAQVISSRKPTLILFYSNRYLIA